jgi:hypothetical protein
MKVTQFGKRNDNKCPEIQTWQECPSNRIPAKDLIVQYSPAVAHIIP